MYISPPTTQADISNEIKTDINIFTGHWVPDIAFSSGYWIMVTKTAKCNC